MAGKPVDVRQRLRERLVANDNGCLLWGGAKIGPGYGYISWRPVFRGPQLTHRVAYMLATGEKLCADDVIAHKCDTPSCCNPEHLFKTTHGGNVADKVAKGRQLKGEQVPQHKLSSDQVREIRLRRAEGVHVLALAREYGVGWSHVYRILRGESWA